MAAENISLPSEDLSESFLFLYRINCTCDNVSHQIIWGGHDVQKKSFQCPPLRVK